MPGFELTSPTTPTWIDLTRDLIVTAATPLDLSVDRLNDLMVLSTQVVAEASESQGNGRIAVTVEVESGRILVNVMSTDGGNLAGLPVSRAALSVLADEHGAGDSSDGSSIWFALHS